MKDIKVKNLFVFYCMFIKKHIFKFTIAFLVTLTVFPIDVIVNPYLSKIFVDKMVETNMNLTVHYILFMGVLIVFGKLLSAALGRVGDILVANFVAIFKNDMREYLFFKVHDHSLSFFENSNSGEIAQKIISLVDQSEHILGFFVGFFTPVMFSTIVSMILIFRFSIFVGLVFLIWVLASLLLSVRLAKNSSAASGKYYGLYSKLNGSIIDSIANNLNIKIFGSKYLEKKYLENISKEEIDAKKESLYKIFSIRTTLKFINTIFFIILFALIFWIKGQKTFPIGDFIFIYSVYESLGGFISWLGIQFSFILQNITISEASLQFLSKPIEIQNVENAKDLNIGYGAISVKDLQFSYGSKNVFEHLSLEIGKKEKIGLIGKSGVGKSTFVKLLMRFYDPGSGSVEIDGQNIGKATQETLRNNISYVTQEPMLFNRSILENIRYGKEEVTIEEVKEAARKANCDFIEELEEGYETIVGERGLKLSGGQKQRIAIARAILKNAPILILDEATSALDSETEHLIQKSLQNLMENKTVIAIAHRLSTISALDRLIVLNEGKIVENGTHKELLERKGYYYKLWNMQTNGFLPQDIKTD